MIRTRRVRQLERESERQRVNAVSINFKQNILYRDEDARGRVTGRMFQCIVSFEFVCLCDFLTFLYGKVIYNFTVFFFLDYLKK